MIVFAELQMMGEKHIMVNSGILQVLENAFPDEQFHLVMDDIHYDSLKKHIGFAPNFSGRTFRLSQKEDRKLNLIFKICREVLTAYRLFLFSKKRKPRFIFFASGFPFTLIFLNWFSAIFKQKIIVCQHGDLGILTLKKDKVTTRIFKKVVNFSLSNRNALYTTLLFYGQSIKNNLFSLYPEFNPENTIAIDHPYEYNFLQEAKKTSEPPVIANIGAAILAKNSHLFFKLGQQFKEDVNENKIRFLQIGNLHAEVDEFITPYVDISLAKASFISSTDFEKGLKNADYFIYFFGKNGYYDLCPSGTFFDSIKFATPIIALRNDFFEYYFNKLGNIGYLCDSLEDIYKIVESIINQENDEEYQIQIDNLIKARSTLSINNIAFEFKAQYKALN